MYSVHRLTAARTALLIVDVQGTFHAIAHDADGVVTRLSALRARARTSGARVVFTRQRFGERVPDIVPAITPCEDDIVVNKDAPDGFCGSDLSDVVASAGVTCVAIAGFATEACIDSTARSALSRGLDIVLLADAHTTTIDRGSDPMAASEVIAHYNATFARLDYPGRSITVAPVRQVQFVS